MVKRIILNAIAFVISFILYYFMLPAFNIHNFGLYGYLFIVLTIFSLCNLFCGEVKTTKFKRNVRISLKDDRRVGIGTYLYLGLVGCFVLIFVINFFYSPIFMSEAYASRIAINEETDFNNDIKEIDFDNLPLLDKDSSSKLGDRVMGQMSELVSQFDVSYLYTQINYNDEIVRVTPLEYASTIKWFTNRSEGVAGFITVNSTTGKSNLVKLENGMKYMPSALFGEDLYRKLRFSYPTKIFGEECFEIDNEGNPYWIIPTMKYSAISLLPDVEGVVILDPISGDSEFYEVGNIPSWVDHVYDPYLIIEQFDDYGMYKNGFWNSIFGQKGVVQTTEGYNYMIQDDDVFLYTGVTSISSDESNIGFIITNLRTKETKYFDVPGAEEYSAMDSAMGQVQQMDYTSTFPLLVNLNDRPTYLISLKDNAGLVKMYAFVDVEDYQKVVVTDASLGISEAARNYISNVDFGSAGNEIIKEIVISNITNASIDGNTYYYIVDNSGLKYKVSIKVSDYLPFLKVGDKVNISYLKEKDIIDIIEIN